MNHHLLLIADAHSNMREGVRTLLAGIFDTVVMVADGTSLCDATALVRPDLLVVDLSLPGNGAGNVLRCLHSSKVLPSTKVIVLSVHDEPEAVHEVFAAGAKGFVLKGSAANELVPAVREVLQGGTYVSPGARSDCDGLKNSVE